MQSDPNTGIPDARVGRVAESRSYQPEADFFEGCKKREKVNIQADGQGNTLGFCLMRKNQTEWESLTKTGQGWVPNGSYFAKPRWVRKAAETSYLEDSEANSGTVSTQKEFKYTEFGQVSEIKELLNSNGLKKTPIRLEMLKVFMSHEVALSASDIVSKMTVKNDLATIYRALTSFEENGIIHRASEDSLGVKYALYNEESTHKSHAHFICDTCHETYCLDDIQVPEADSSSDFIIKGANYTLNGVCKKCQK